jgi:predicted MPP superfamily phosphohydrolase
VTLSQPLGHGSSSNLDMSVPCTPISLCHQSCRVLTPRRLLPRPVILALAVICAFFSSRADAQNEEQPVIKIEPKSNVFLAYGDIRFTEPSRCDVSNARSRTALVERMAGPEENPDFIVMTGDIVYNGDDKNDWKVFNEETKPLRERHVRLFPVLGNHDVRGPSGRHNFVNHFDELKAHGQLETRTWYALEYGNAYFIMLDSQTTYESRTPQGEWLRSQLKSAPDDLDFLFVVLHHPLVTHPSRFPVISRCDGNMPKPQLGHDVEDAEKRLRIILQEFSQTHPNIRICVLSGHNHNYERYSVKGITYVVTAGGGATPYRILRRNTDAYHEPGPTYHYCRIAIQAHTLQFQMYKLRLSGTVPEWELKDSFRLTAAATRQIASGRR